MDIHHNPGLNEVRIDWKLDRDFCWDLSRIWEIMDRFDRFTRDFANEDVNM